MSNKTVFSCNKCDYSFVNKYNLDRHTATNSCKSSAIENKEKMKNVSSLELFEDDEIKCKHCDKGFPKKYKLKRHLESNKGECYKIRNNIISQTVNQHVVNKNYHQNINNFIQPVVNNLHKHQHITIAKHGEETISHITKEIMLELLKLESFTKMSTELTRLLYFNDEVPENKNWSIVYPKNKKAGLELNHETNKFQRVETEKIINYKFSNMIGLFLPMIELIDGEDREVNNLSRAQQVNIRKFTSYFGVTQISKEARYIYDSIKEMVYNERLKTMKTWKENGHEGNHLSLKF